MDSKNVVNFVDLSTAAGIITIDGSFGSVFQVDRAAGNQTVVVKNVRPGQRVRLIFQQDSTGSRTLTVDGTTVQTAEFQAGASYLPAPGPLAITEYEIVGQSATDVNISKVLPVQNGAGTLVAGEATISAVLTAQSRITIGLTDPGAGAITDFAGLWADAAGRNVGASTFHVQALKGADKGILATAVCTFDWRVEG